MSAPGTLRIGTRGSALAMWQAEHVASLIAELPGAPATELVEIKTEGDVITDTPLSRVAGKAFFTKEIESALLADEVDLAVHSLKDLATVMPAGLAVGAVLKREDPRDVLIARAAGSVDNLAPGSRVGTSSLRRRALLARWRNDLELLDLRGNVPTRLRKVDEGEFDAVVLAAAGVRRLGLGERITAYLSTERMLPAVSQGAVAVQVREGDGEVLRWIAPLDHALTRAATTAERALLRTLEGGCQVPVGALALTGGRDLDLAAIVCSLDGTFSVRDTRSGPLEGAEGIGTALAETLLERGAERILAEIRSQAGEAGK